MRKWMTLAVLAAGVVVGSAQQAEAGCTTGLLDCYQKAANIESFWYRTAAGIDCELDFVECVRIKLIGT